MRLALVLRVAAGMGFTHVAEDVASSLASVPSDEDVALITVWAAHESGLQLDPAPVSADARAGLSGGLLQQRGGCGRGSALHQVRCWLRLRAWYAARCGDDGLSGVASGRCGGARGLVEARKAEAMRLASP
jgi:hypothetical protein